jgi:hypothetical protein
MKKSSRIKSAKYNKDTEVLTVEFVKGGIYKYYSFTEENFKAFEESESPGRFFDIYIKPNHKFKKV